MGSAKYDRVIFLYFYGLLIAAGVGEGFTLEDTDGVGVGIEGVETVLDEGGLATGEVDKNLRVGDGFMDADVGYAVDDAQLGIFRGDADGVDGAVLADAQKNTRGSLRAGGVLTGGDDLTCGDGLGVIVVRRGTYVRAHDGGGLRLGDLGVDGRDVWIRWGRGLRERNSGSRGQSGHGEQECSVPRHFDTSVCLDGFSGTMLRGAGVRWVF